MTSSIPTRHPEKPLAVPTGIRLFAQVLGVTNPDAQQWRRMGEQLNVGDEPMDTLVEWMVSAGLKETRAMFDQALAGGIASVPDAPEPLREFFAVVEATPDWVDPWRIRTGQQAMLIGGADGMYVARDVALLGGYQFAGFNKTLLRTGALEKGSNARFAETMLWAMDVISANGMDLFAVGYRSTLRVRLIHSLVRRHVEAMPDWRGDDWGVPVNQTDMAATLVGALIAPPVGGLGMGILPAPGDLEAIAHLTRYVGWLMGVQDEWLPRDFRDAMRILYHTSTALSTPDETTQQLSVPMAQDPLKWHYGWLPGLRRRLAHAQHLSVTSAFLGPRAMRALGLPTRVAPWYPVLRLPVNVARSVASMILPGGRDRAARRGVSRQAAFLRTIAGEAHTTVGASAVHMNSVA